MTFTNITRLPSGRGIAADCRGIWTVKNYDPSGAVRRQEREYFYNSEPTYFLRGSPSNKIVGGDFNRVLNKADTTDHFNYTRVLEELFQDFELQDTWQANFSRSVFKYYSPMGANRMDRIYATGDLIARKIGGDCSRCIHRQSCRASASDCGCPHRTARQRFVEYEHLPSR
jgi:hypothetical protein